MSTSESWGVNGHTARCTSTVSAVLQRVTETEISAALFTHETREGLCLCSDGVKCMYSTELSAEYQLVGGRVVLC